MRLEALQQRIELACARYGRNAADITLIGVSKTKPAEDIVSAYNLGLTQFGENYLQEAVDKIQKLQSLTAQWHYIGAIQSNKTRDIAAHFDWVHTVDRIKIGSRLSAQCPQGKTVKVLVQVNIDSDPNKSGCPRSQAAALVHELLAQPNLEIRGLMTILSKDSEPRASYESVAQLAYDIGRDLNAAQRERWDTLSMGMTGDMDEAIAAGATHIRIGTALFGGR
ncbi:MAG: YggS family pyridoxal phosphate-dependent enzyme [Proteobacteria bacterium]|nr:YggS family pyridoxal phosphate-dependent enzyme [Pseudomonadota bacterium]